MTYKFVVVDLETTGNSAEKGDRIIQFAAVVVENGRIIDTFSSLVNPFKTIPPFIEELTGLTNEDVKTAPPFEEIAPTIVALLDNAYFVAHNVLFDLTFLQEELIEAGFRGFFGPVLDTVELARFLYPTSDSYKLSDLASQESVVHDRPHQADSDAYATAELLLLYMRKLKQLPPSTLYQLLKHSGGLKSDISLFLDEIIIPGATEEVLPELEIVHGIALRKQRNTKDSQVKPMMAYPEDRAAKMQLFKQAMAEYELRDGQFQMMDTVYEALRTDTHAAIEAGCGVGKSVAYLLPAYIFSKQKNEKIVISTYTTQLQDQLLLKEIPTLSRMLSTPLNTVLLKGKHHYLDLAKFAESLEEDDDNYDTSLTKMQILVWLTETCTGDVEELNISSGGKIYWNRVKKSSYTAVGEKKWLQYDFFTQLKERVQYADLVITNHSMLLADATSAHPILPAFSYVIIDEAHHFNQTASSSLLQQIDYMSLRLLLNQFGTYEQKQLFYRIVESLPTRFGEGDPFAHPFIVNQIVTDLQIEVDNLFKSIQLFLKSTIRQSGTKMMKRILPDENSREWKTVVTIAERLLFLLKDFIENVQNYAKALHHNQLHGPLNDTYHFLDELDQVITSLRSILLHPMEEWVRWVEMDVRAAQNVSTVYTKPVTVSKYLAGQFFNQKKSVIMTSATLTVDRSFAFILNEWGLNESQCQTLAISSPFSYQRQVRLYIPNDLPEVNKVPVEDYVAAIAEQLISLAEITRGRMMILFTSNDMLKKTYELIKESGLLDDYAIFAQGITSGSRSRLTRNFQRFEKAILLGTSSFWEGVDIPGEALSCLVIVRLPFAPPDDPLLEARSERIRQQGGNPFTMISLPEAILKFKQGFGRLIRSSSDRGILVVFDQRIVSSYYGKAFLSSIPDIPTRVLSLDSIIDEIDEWL